MKKELGPKNLLYPMPTTIVGATVNNKPNFCPIAHVGIMDLGSVSLGIFKKHYTNAGIIENKTFSVNIPSVDLIEKTDYCGLVSGKDVDKGSLFTVFYGKLKTAPLIEECPINMECKLIQTVDFPNHDIFIGEVVNTYFEEDILTDGDVDINKVKPLLFVMNDRSYYKLGEKIANAWDVGKNLKKKI